MEKDLFSQVLDQQEKILKIYKPSTFRAWFTIVISTVFLFIFLLPVVISSVLNQENNMLGIIVGGMSFLVLYVLILVTMIALWLNKTVFAVTNKRILIRTGYIGVDYISLDYTMLGAVTVNVSWIDKLLRKNTGSISFGSMASPMVSNNVSKFNFSYIKNPYETYREVKTIIDSHKSKNIENV